MTAEITYGLERIAMYLQRVDNVYHIKWNDDITYGDVYHQAEVEYSTYNFEEANDEKMLTFSTSTKQEAIQACGKKPCIAGLRLLPKCSHTFNLLDARNAISVPSGPVYRPNQKIARKVAEAYVPQREEMGFPLLKQRRPAG